MNTCKNCGAIITAGRTYCDNECRKTDLHKSFTSRRLADAARDEARRLDRLTTSSRRNSPFSKGRQTGI